MKTAAATMKGFEVMRMIRRGHCLTGNPHVKDEVHFVNKLFDIFDIAAWVKPRNGRTATNRVNATEPALTVEEIPALLAEYRGAAQRSKDAGLDGVELHAGNGYLLDQFLQNGSNHHTDEYGGSPENRARLLLQAIDAVLSV